MNKIGIVMPVANEEENIADTIKQILELPYPVVWFPVMDHYSKDCTEEIIKKAEKEHPERIHFVYYEDAHGVATCYLYGFQIALQEGCDCIVEMDAGGSHLFSEFHQFIEKLEEGYDCVWGSRFIKGSGIENHPLYRRMLSRGGTFLSNIVLGTRLKDMTSGYEAFQASVLQNLRLDQFLSTGHMYQTEMRYYCRNYKTIEVPIHYIGSESSLKFKAVKEALKILFQLKKHQKNVVIQDK